MTRKLRGCLLLLAHLTILPGCQSLPYFGGSTSEAPKKVHNHDLKPVDEISTAIPRDDNSKTIEQPTQGPPYEAGSSRSNNDGKKKTTDGVTGIVTLEPDTTPPKLIEFQIAILPQLEKNPDYEPIVMALQRMLEGRHQEAIKYLSAYDNDRQELFLRLLPPLTILVKKRMEELSTQEVAVLNKQMEGILETLRPRSELVVSKMCYAKEVRGYGAYEPLPENHQFLTGTEARIGEFVQLYVELKNFSSEPTKEGEFLTKLACTLELHDQAGKKVWSKSFVGKETTLRRQTRMHDFYSRYGFYVPAIPAGKYQLTLQIADETNAQQRRVAEKSLVFQVTPVANQLPVR